MRRPKLDKRSELAVQDCCQGSVHRGKTGLKAWQQYAAQMSGRLAAKDLYFPFQTLRYIWDGSIWVLSSLPFSPINLDKGASIAAMDVRLARLPATARYCQLAKLDRWTGEIALPRRRHDNFFELGGHSLSVIQLTVQVQRSLGINISLRDLFMSCLQHWRLQ